MGTPSTLHLWWARRPLAAARAVLFSSSLMIPPRDRNCFLLRRPSPRSGSGCSASSRNWWKWESTTNETVLEAARGGDSQELAAYLRGQQRPSQGNGVV